MQRVLILLATLLVAGLTARLGWWQWSKAETKLALQAEQQAFDALPPLDGAQSAQFAPQRRAKLQGRWLPTQQLWLGNRPMHGQTGFVLLTPLQLSDGRLIWVQRGWHPRARSGFEAPPWPPSPVGEVQVEGRLARQASQAFQLGQEGAGPIRQNLDLSRSPLPDHSLLPWVLWQSKDCSPLRCDWPTPDLGVSKNQGYAAQWFAMSALTLGLYVWFQLLRPRRRDPH